MSRVIAAWRAAKLHIAAAEPLGQRWLAKCPLHPDEGFQVTITVGVHGHVGIACSRGCSVESIAEKLGVALECIEAGPPVPMLYPAEYGTSVLPIDPWGSGNESASRPYRLYSAADLDYLPSATWIVEGAIPESGIVGLIGPKGTCKTFVALDLCCHIAAGLPWHGRSTAARAVLYVYAEGAFGAKARLDAWCAYQSQMTGHEFPRASLPLWFLPIRIPINSPVAVAELLEEIRRLPEVPAIVTLDTVNINLDGDEDGTGMGGFVAGCARLRDTLGATIIPVHHTPLTAENRGRGHSSFDGALDTRLIVSRDTDRVTVTCTHQRNGPDGWSVAFEALSLAGSLVLKPSAPNDGQLRGQRREILEVLQRQGTMRYTDLIAATEISPSSFRKARKGLLAKGYIRQQGRSYSASDAGLLALGHPEHSGGHRA